MNSNAKYFKNFDAIRFLAATMVLAGHGFSKALLHLPEEDSWWKRSINMICNGETGVSLFFVLSGFLISYLLMEEKEHTGSISLAKFYLRRMLRIWPLYFTVVIIGFVIFPGLKSMVNMNHPLSSNVWYHLSFLSNFDAIHIEQFSKGNDALIQNITWSVSIEEQFYLVWPLLFVFLPPKWRLPAILLVIGGSFVFRMAHSGELAVLYFHTFSVMMDLGMGALAAFLLRKKLSWRKYLQNMDSKRQALLFLLTLLILYFQDILFRFPYGEAINRLVCTGMFALIISIQAVEGSNNTLQFQRLRFASKWGKYTYGMYLLHPMMITLVDIAYRISPLPQNDVWLLCSIAPLSFLLTLVASRLSYLTIEAPFLRWKEKFSAFNAKERLFPAEGSLYLKKRVSLSGNSEYPIFSHMMLYSKYNGTILGALFSALNLLLSLSFIVPILSVLPGAFLEKLVATFVSNEPYSNIGKTCLFLLLLILVGSVAIFGRHVRKISRKGTIRPSIILVFFFFEFLIVHPLGFYIYWSNMDFRGDGQLIFSVMNTFPYSSCSFLFLGIIIDVCKQKNMPVPTEST